MGFFFKYIIFVSPGVIMRCFIACSECSWMVAHTRAVIVMRGLIFHHVVSSA
jgi:hypothetical protein